MSDNSSNINVKVIMDPSQTQAGSADIVAAIQGASADIQTALGKITTASNSTSAAVRSGMADVESAMKSMSAQINGVASAVQASGAQVAAAMSNVSSSAGTGSRGLNGLSHSARGVRREFIVMAHEIATGNWTRLGGSAMVMAERMDLLGKISGATGVGIGLVTAAIALVAAAAIKGAEEMSMLNREMVATGGAAGLTAQRYEEVASAIAAANDKITEGQARSAVLATAGTGAFFGPQTVQAVSAAVAEISRLTGQTAEKVAADFAKMDEGVYKYATTNTEAKNLITEAEAEQIRALEEKGEKEQAEILLANDIVASLKRVSDATGETTGMFEQLEQMASRAWQAMKDALNPTLEQQIANLRNQASSVGFAEGGDATAAALNAQADALQKKLDAQKAAVAQASQTAENNRENKAGNVTLDEMSVRYDKAAAKARELTQAQTALNEAIKGIPTDASQRSAEQQREYASAYSRYNTIVAGINSRGEKKQSVGGAAAPQKAEDTGELALIKDRLAYEQSLLETSYKDNEIDLQTYFARRKQIIDQGYAAEIAVARRGVENAEAAAKYAVGPSQQNQAQAQIITAKNRVALLTQQETEAEAKLTAEMQQQVDAQKKALAQIQQTRSQNQANFEDSQVLRIAQMEVTQGRITSQQLIAIEMELENRRYEIALAGFQEREKLGKLTVQQQAQLDSQIEQLEQQHQSKMTELSIQSLNEQDKAQKQAYTDMQNDLEQLTEQLVEKPKQWKQSFMDFFNTIQQQMTKLVTQQLGSEFLGAGSSGGNGLNSLLSMVGLGGKTGALNNTGPNGANSPGGILSSQNVSTQTVTSMTVSALPQLQVASMTVSNMVANSTTGSSDSSSGGSGILSMFSGAFGSGTGAGASGSEAAGAAASSTPDDLIAAYAQGTNYVPTTGLALLHQGEAVVPASYNSQYNSSGFNVTNNFAISGPVSKRTQSQIAGMAGASSQQALRRNG